MNLAGYVLRLVKRAPKGYTFVPAAPRGVALALDDLFASGADPRPQLLDLLRLAWVFEARHRSARMADALVAWLAKDSRVTKALGIANTASALRAQFAKFSGREHRAAAPKHGAKAPAGAIEAHRFMDPGTDLRRALRSRPPRPAGDRPAPRGPGRRRFQLS